MSIVCQRCNQAKATVHITDTVPQQREQHLCEACAEQEGVIIKPPQTTNEILQQFIKHKQARTGVDDVSCPRCGMTFREFQLNGQLGCPEDYRVFQAMLDPLLERAHEGATQHVGKVPTSADEATMKHAALQRLRHDLSDAIDQEKYELAARVRDQIKTLESA